MKLTLGSPTSRNVGTQIRRSLEVDLALLKTISEVGICGGDVGLKVDNVTPVVSC